MEELLQSAPFLLPFFRCYLASPLMYAYSTFSGKEHEPQNIGIYN